MPAVHLSISNGRFAARTDARSLCHRTPLVPQGPAARGHGLLESGPFGSCVIGWPSVSLTRENLHTGAAPIAAPLLFLGEESDGTCGWRPSQPAGKARTAGRS